MADDELPLVATVADLARYLHVTVRTVDRWRAQAAGPPWVKMGFAIRYERAAVREWMKRSTVTTK